MGNWVSDRETVTNQVMEGGILTLKQFFTH